MEALQYPFFQRALLAGLLASVACGVVGAFVVVRRIAAISGGLSHSAFGGIGLAFLVGAPPLAGATAFSVLAAVVVGLAYRRLRQGFDTLIAMVWSVGMALGVLLLALAPGYAPDLTSYLFGSILFVPTGYLWLALGLDIVIVAAVAILYSELRAVVFDEEFAQVVGVAVEILFLLLLTLTALAVVVLIRVVGIILVIALLTIPASIARQWSADLKRMMVLGTAIGASTTTLGLFTSYWLSDGFGVDVPTGPVIILIATVGYGISTALRRTTAGDQSVPGAASVG